MINNEKEAPFKSGFDLAVEALDKGGNSQHNKCIERYSKAKKKALEHLNYIKNNEPHETKLINALDGCGNYLLFHEYPNLNEKRLAGICTCKKHLICPLCAIRRGSKQVSAYMQKLNIVFNENNRLKPYLVTLTVKNGNNLIERYKHLKKSVQYLYKKRQVKKAISESKKSKGAVWSYEIKKGKNSGLWHPHVHAIWLCEEPPSHENLSNEWLSITKDSHIVDIREIKNDNDEALVKSLCEVFKYAVKFSDQPAKDTYECFKKLSRMRLLGSMGNLYGVKVPKIMNDDLLDEEPYFELFYNYFNDKYNFSKKSELKNLKAI